MRFDRGSTAAAAMSAAAMSAAAMSDAAGRALSPFSRPLHHFPWDRPGQKPQLLTSTGERARKVVKGPPGQGRTIAAHTLLFAKPALS
jgi:hypothetical protein